MKHKKNAERSNHLSAFPLSVFSLRQPIDNQGLPVGRKLCKPYQNLDAGWSLPEIN